MSPQPPWLVPLSWNVASHGPSGETPRETSVASSCGRFWKVEPTLASIDPLWRTAPVVMSSHSALS